MKKIVIIFILIFIVLPVLSMNLLLSGCTSQKASVPPDEVSVQLKWVHQAQFAGFYLAQDEGYYSVENINVKFIEGGAGIDLVEPLINGQADFSQIPPEQLIMECCRGVPIKAIAAIYRQSPVVFISKADSQIIKPSDFIGKTVAILGQTEAEIQFYAMMNKLGFDISEVNLIEYSPDYTEFLNNEADVTYVYITGGLIKLQQKGYELNIIWPGDYGVKFYADLLVANEDMISQNPGLITRFLKATLKGWEDAIGGSESAVESTLKYAKIKERELQLAMMNAQEPLINTGEDYIGWMKDEEWQAMYKTLFEQKLIDTPIDYKKLYTVEFLNKVYKEKTE